MPLLENEIRKPQGKEISDPTSPSSCKIFGKRLIKSLEQLQSLD